MSPLIERLLSNFWLLIAILVVLLIGVLSNVYFAFRGMAERKLLLEGVYANSVVLDKMWARMSRRGYRKDDDLNGSGVDHPLVTAENVSAFLDAQVRKE